MPALTYRTQFAKVRPSKLEALAKRLRIHAKEQVHLPKSFPTAVLEGPSKEGGIGLEGLVDVAARTKLRLIESSLNSTATEDIRSAVEGLLARELRRQGALLSGLTCEIGTRSAIGNTWISEAIQHLRETNCVLKCTMQQDTNSMDMHLPHEVAKRLPVHWDVSVIGDLLQEVNGLMRPIPFTPLLQYKPEDKVYIRPGQGWAVGSHREQHLWIVKGWSENQVVMEEWKCTTQWIRKRTKSPTCTWSGYKHINWDTATQLRYRVLMSKSTLQGGKLSRTIITEFNSSLTKRPTRIPTTAIPLQNIVATDGSWKSTASVFGNPSVTAAAGIVQLNPHCRSSPARAYHITGFAIESESRVFAQESIAVAIAMAGGATHIHTDSKSVFNQTNSKRPSGNRVIDLIKGKSSALVQHIYAHPEGRKLKQEWTHLEWGNHMADRVADRDPNFAATDISAEEASQFLMEKSQREDSCKVSRDTLAPTSLQVWAILLWTNSQATWSHDQAGPFQV